MTRSRADVVTAAGRLFAQRGYHGTSMRDLGRELGLHGSSLYSHVASKEDLLVEVVERGGELFEAAAAAALSTSERPPEQLRALVAGHIGVVLDHIDTARTFLNEARSLEPDQRQRVVTARNRYEQAFRTVIAAGIESGDFRPDADPKVAAIFTLSILNAIDRWYSESGRLSRTELVDDVMRFVEMGISAGA